MSKTRRLTAVQTSAGRGTRSRPLSLYSPTSMIPKGLMRIMGLPIAELQIEEFMAAGIEDVYIITRYLENREHLSNKFEDGQRFGLRIHYSDPSDDRTNKGSADAILTNIEKNGLDGDSIWLPNDNLFEYDHERIIQAHRDLGAVVSIMTIMMNPRATLNTYGLMKTSPDHKVLEASEKPEDDQKIMEVLGISNPRALDSMRVGVNTAGYGLNNEALAEIAKDDWVVEGRKNVGFDMYGVFIRELVERGYPVYEIPIDGWGDFGSNECFLDTFPGALSGNFPSIFKVLEAKGYYHDASNNVWIHPDSLNMADEEGKTLKQRIKEGRVKIGPNVFIGIRTHIGDGAEIRYSDLEEYTRIGEHAKLDHTYLSPYCEIGPYAYLQQCALGLQVMVGSSKESRTLINGRSVLGPSIEVPVGTTLEEVNIFPGYRFKKPGEVFTRKTLRPTTEQVKKTLELYR